MRYLGHRDVWENCYFSTYGRETALRYGEKRYCYHGELFYLDDDSKVFDYKNVCPDWHKCRGLNKVVQDKKGKRKKVV